MRREDVEKDSGADKDIFAGDLCTGNRQRAGGQALPVTMD
jgi:hypothetical protein